MSIAQDECRVDGLLSKSAEAGTMAGLVTMFANRQFQDHRDSYWSQPLSLMFMDNRRFSLTEITQGSFRASRPTRSSVESGGGEHHRDITGGGARAAVFGVSDGLVSNVALILGVAGAHPSAPFVAVAGLAGLVGGSLSMAMGEYVSMKAQRELFERELRAEEREIKRRPEAEQRELVQRYRSKGVPQQLAEDFAGYIMQDPALALDTHAREELGIDPSSIGSPIQAASSSLFSFAFGALVPLLPWFFITGTAALFLSVVLGAVAAVLVGVLLAKFTGRSWIRTAFRQLLLSGIAAGFTYLVGHFIGASSL